MRKYHNFAPIVDVFPMDRPQYRWLERDSPTDVSLALGAFFKRAYDAGWDQHINEEICINL